MASSRSTLAVAGVAGLVLLAFVAFLAAGHAGDDAVLMVNNLLQTLSALGAGLVCAMVARGATGGPAARRGGWAAMAVGLLSWGSGQAYWSWSEIVAKREVPFPSLADLGFLVFPAASALAVVLFQVGTSASRSRFRAACDGLVVATSLFLVSWATVLHTVYKAGAESRFAFGVALAYPIGDLVVVALALLLLARLTSRRLPMALLAAGLIAMGVADSGFAYLTTAGTYQTGSVIDVGWVAAFLLCGVAAAADSNSDQVVQSSHVGLSRVGLLLPLAPFAAGTGYLVADAWGSQMDRPMVIGGAALMILIVVRQMLVLAENTDLVATVQQREEQLRYQAFHDPLTGLANRLLFRDRLEHAAAVRQREGRPLTVLFLDLDDFKLVNDRLGHAAGDALLVDVAERLRACLRKGDTVARLGGDEFAVLLQDDGEEPEQLARRIVDAMEVPFQLGPARVQVTGSIGVAVATARGRTDEVSERLLHRADVAMYAAKRDSKGSYVVYSDGMRMLPGGPPRSRHAADATTG
jgi:diguanylate cyclase (GGDEF)-like protein